MPPLSYTKVQHIWVCLGALCSTAQAVYTPPNILQICIVPPTMSEIKVYLSQVVCLISIQGLYSPHRMSWAVFFSLSRSVCVSNRDNLFLQSLELACNTIWVEMFAICFHYFNSYRTIQVLKFFLSQFNKLYFSHTLPFHLF